VEHVLHTEKPSPPIDWNNWWKELNHTAVIVIVVPPLLSIWGLLFAPLHWQTAVWAVVYYFITGIGMMLARSRSRWLMPFLDPAITAGYHRLWAHRAYKASKVLEYVLAVASAGAIQGTIRWWCRGHRAHHRYTDTELDPYNAQHGFWYTHVGWMLFKPRRKPGVADVSDLIKNKVVRWQSDNYSWLALLMAFGVPTVVAGVGWGDWKGGYFYAGVIRLVFVQHVR
jgi:stearoyl-CoA desaturase (delta-9 desaturase)